MIRTRILPMAIVAGALATTAHAMGAPSGSHHLTANVGVHSNYVFRGLTQTNEKPALQGGFDYANDNGFYLGTWLSNISWFSDTNGGTSSLEWDGYGGFRKTWAGGVLTDIGYLRYQYPGEYPELPPGTTRPDTDEAYLGVGWKWVTLKYSYSLGDTFGVGDAKSTSYIDLTVAIPLPQGFALSLHAGRQKFKGSSAFAESLGKDNDDLYTYEDCKATLTYSFGGSWTAGAAYTHSSAKDEGYTVLGDNLGDDQFVVSLSRAF